MINYRTYNIPITPTSIKKYDVIYTFRTFHAERRQNKIDNESLEGRTE